jgi:hypothetical protein
MNQDAIDRLRQGLNVAGAVGQILGTAVIVTSGAADRTFDSGPPPSLVTPAGYAFSVWSLIYAGSLAYAVYQASPRRRVEPLLRRIGWYTAAAFTATILWLLAVQGGRLVLTVPLIFALMAALVGAFIELIRHPLPRTAAERWLVERPLSVYAGWATVAAVANTAEVLKGAGYAELAGLPDQAWAILMLLIAGGIGAYATSVSRGNAAYAGTVLWALTAVVAANFQRDPARPAVAATATAAAGLVAWYLWRSRRRRKPDSPETKAGDSTFATA